MRIRTIKPEFWQNEFISQLPDFTQLLAIGLLNLSDDEGYFNANPGLIKSALFPLRDVSVKIHGAITELSGIGFIRLYKGTDGRSYGHVVNFLKHQVVNRPRPSVIKPLCIALDSITEPSRNSHGTFTESSVKIPTPITEPSRNGHGSLTAGMEGNGREGNIHAEPEPRPASPSASESFLFDQLAEIECGAGKRPTKIEAGKIRHALAAILAASPDVTPWEIDARAKRYPAVMPPGAKLTAHALAANWGKCEPKKEAPPAPIDEGPEGWRERLEAKYPGNMINVHKRPFSEVPPKIQREIEPQPAQR